MKYWLFILVAGFSALALCFGQDKADPITSTPNDVLTRAQQFIRDKDYAIAEEILHNLIEKPGISRPVEAQAILLRGKLALETNRPAEALVWLKRYVQDFADQAEAPYANFLLGQTYKQVGAYDIARENFYKTLSFAISKASSFTVDDFASSLRLTQAAAWELAETEYLSTNWARADELYERFKAQNPDLDKLISTALYRQADCVYQQGRTQDAITRYESALSNAPFHPFATESWLRLVTLYGQLKEPRKQADALRSFIWIVNNLQPEHRLYWQRRCADLLLLNYHDNPEEQIPLLETILSFETSEEWMKMLDFYLSLLNRQVPGSQANFEPSANAHDDWNAWLKDFTDRIGKIRQKFEVMRAQDKSSASSAMPQPMIQ